MPRARVSPDTSAYTDQQLILAARLYYLESMSQAEIGKFVHVSQSKVSRMLALAQQRGLVRITIPEFQSRNTALEQALKKRLQVEAIVVHTLPGVETTALRQIVGYFSAPAVQRWFEPRKLVILAGGRTIQQVIEQMKPNSVIPDLRFAQGMGLIDASPGPYDAAELCRSMARVWNGAVLSLNAPLLYPSKDSCQRFTALPQIQEVLHTIANADIALVGVGSLQQSVIMDRALYTKAELAELERAGTVGEILGRFYNASGVECQTTLRERTLSLRLDQLKKIRRRVGVVVGGDRAAAIYAAIRGGLLNTVVIDEGAATALLAMLQS